MENSLGEVQTIVLLGGTSEIGLAIVRELTTPTLRTVVLACRDAAAVEPTRREIARGGVDVKAVTFDAVHNAYHRSFVEDLATQVGDLDVVVIAFGILGDQQSFDEDPARAARAVEVNYVGAVSAGLAAAAQMRKQGHGRIVFLSSVAGERVRAGNFVYGSSKAGLDSFAQGLGDSLEGSGVRVLVVRPGFVHSKMTAGMRSTPLSSTPESVAVATARALRSGRRIVWVPGALRLVFMILRHLPRVVFRRLPLG
jgi:decaprenylphospho-beta-D-erythro-pentofuranosid-2-ulose 2-reductase